MRELLDGKHAHADSRTCVDVPFEIAAKPAGGLPHTIWQLVWHVDYWMEYELLRIAGKPRPYPEHAAESWPRAAPSGPEEWRSEVERFGRLLDQLGELAQSLPSELARLIPATDRAEAAHASSLEAVLWQTVVHNSYHIGQLVQLRQALQAWPPRTGSDTW
jgi:uncharacterized damage-inducible protein DinB